VSHEARVRLKLNERQKSAENCCDHVRLRGGAFGQMLNRSSHGMLTQIILTRWTEIHIQQRSKLSHLKLQWLTRFIGVTKSRCRRRSLMISTRTSPLVPSLITVYRADNFSTTARPIVPVAPMIITFIMRCLLLCRTSPMFTVHKARSAMTSPAYSDSDKSPPLRRRHLS
jgi:hypothetical protein